MSEKNLIIFAMVPALLVLLLFELFLGHRHDYSGHYAAGYGATFAAAMFLLRLLVGSNQHDRAVRLAVPFCVACILGGAIAEATAFRIAKFDEIDFCNQSLGAVLATICASAFIGRGQYAPTLYDYGLIVGIAFLGIGGVLAVA